MEKTSKKVSCKFCDWSVPLWTVVGGKSVNGFTRLHRHMKDCHARQFDALTKSRDKEEDQKLKDAIQMAEGEEP